MKIYFVIDGVMPVYTYKQLQIFNYDSSLYNFVKVLEKSKDFEYEVKKIRKAVNLPVKGYSIKEFISMLLLKHYDDDIPETTKNLLKKVTKQSISLLNTFRIPKELVTEIPYVIIANMIHANSNSIDVDYEDKVIDIDYFKIPFRLVSIRIANRISKSELIEWVNKNWKSELNLIQLLPEKNHLRISKRDLEIVRLRNKEKLTFNEVAKKIIEKYKIDDPEGRINENSIKMAYKRAKDTIKSLKK